jgi:hypothetical protein
MKLLKTIGIADSEALSNGQRRLLSALGEIFDFQMKDCGYNETGLVDAWIFPRATADELTRIGASAFPCFAVVSCDPQLVCPDTAPVTFDTAYSVPPVLAGRSIPSEESAGIARLPDGIAASAVAWKGASPVWSVRGSAPHSHHFVATALPDLAENEGVYVHFSNNRFLALLPLIAFLREVTEDPRWEEPPIRACFMFDDPNLHWNTYGHIDFRKLVRHAQQHNYHVCSATIPLDAWFFHAPTAALFREHSDRISLLIHGNDHLNQELARTARSDERLGMLAQAIRRIESLERRSNVEVSRIMAPPHGACSEEALASMAILGFEAACISRGSLRHYNPNASWARGIGMRPSDVIRGLPVLPRFRVTPHCQNSILLSVLLRQPIIAVGHHHDVADGLGLFADLASFINSLGDVQWASTASIARSHHSRLVDSDVLHVKMHTKRADIAVPEGIARIAVHRPWLEVGASEELRIAGATADLSIDALATDATIPVQPRQHVSIISSAPPDPLATQTRRHGLRPWPVVRRLLTETRDRLAPKLRRV